MLNILWGLQNVVVIEIGFYFVGFEFLGLKHFFPAGTTDKYHCAQEFLI